MCKHSIVYVNSSGDACLGALLLVVDERLPEKSCRIHKKKGIKCSVIRAVVPRENGVKIAGGKGSCSFGNLRGRAW